MAFFDDLMNELDEIEKFLGEDKNDVSNSEAKTSTKESLNLESPKETAGGWDLRVKLG